MFVHLIKLSKSNGCDRHLKASQLFKRTKISEPLLLQTTGATRFILKAILDSIICWGNQLTINASPRCAPQSSQFYSNYLSTFRGELKQLMRTVDNLTKVPGNHTHTKRLYMLLTLRLSSLFTSHPTPITAKPSGACLHLHRFNKLLQCPPAGPYTCDYPVLQKRKKFEY
jgi:hypothetical protein